MLGMYRLAKILWNFPFNVSDSTWRWFLSFYIPKTINFYLRLCLFLLTSLFEITCTHIILRIFLVFCRQPPSPPSPPPPRSAVWGRRGRQNIFSDGSEAARMLSRNARLVAQWTGLTLIKSNLLTKVLIDYAAVSCPKPKIRKALEISKVWT